MYTLLMLCCAGFFIGVEGMPKSLTVHVPLTDPTSEWHLDDKRAKLIDNAVKLNYPLLECFKLMYNVTITYRIEHCLAPNANSATAILEKCATNALHHDDADISLYPMMISAENLRTLDFPALSSTETIKFIFLEPKLALIANIYALPFASDVWLATMALAALAIAFLFAVGKWQWYKQTTLLLPVNDAVFSGEMAAKEEWAASNTDMLDREDTFLEVAFVAIGAMSQQGTEREPKGFPARLSTWFLFLSFMFLYAAYSANVVTLLQATSNEIQNVRDLLVSALNTGVHNSSVMQYALPLVSGDDRLALLDKSAARSANGSIDFTKLLEARRGIEKLRFGMYAFHVESHIGYTLIEDTFDEVQKCTVQEVQFLPFPIQQHFAIKKNSSMYEMFKIGFLLLRENGLHFREEALLHTPKPRCWTLDVNFNSVGLDECYYAVAFFASGVLLSVIIMLFEIAVYHTLRMCC